MRRRRLVLLLALAVMAGLAGWLVREPFRHWQERRLVEKARQFFTKGDFRSAYLSSREALLKNPQSIAAGTVIAQIAELEQSPAAIFWRQQLADLQPGSTGPRIELAATALRFGETYIAEQALAQVREPDRNSVAYLQISASLAIAFRQYAAAESQFQKALELDPTNEGLQLNLATMRLALARPGQVEQARAVIETLRTSPRSRRDALRALIGDARTRGDSARAMQLASELRQDAQATIGDHLLYLEQLQLTGSKDFAPELSSLQSTAGTRSDFIYSLMTWMNAHGIAAQSLEWSTQLPPQIRARLPIPLALAEACTILKDWKRLGKLLAENEWEDLEFLRVAIHARLLRETSSHPSGADFTAMWERAMNATAGNPNSLLMLARLVNGWGWKDEAIQVWWLAARSGTTQRAALKALYRIHSADKNTRELYRVARQVHQMEPANPVAKNNVASLAFLLGEDGAEAHRLAAEIYKLAPTQPEMASTYAMSLHKQKRDSEAIAILRPLAPAALSDPSIAALYGFLLAQNGEAKMARTFLEAADRRKDQLFPEEAAMVADALKALP